VALALLFLAYMVAAHYSVTEANPYPGLTLLAIVLLWSMLPALRRGSAPAWLALLTLAGMLAGLILLDHGQLLLYLPPVAINLVFLAGFARSLLPGETPLITRIAAAFGDELTPQRRRYARKVTVAWTVLFALLTVECVLLALFGSPRLWSLFTNVINYLIVAVFFLLEYLLRSRRFPHPDGFVGFIKGMRRVDVRRLMQSQKPSR